MANNWLNLDSLIPLYLNYIGLRSQRTLNLQICNKTQVVRGIYDKVLNIERARVFHTMNFEVHRLK